MSGRGRFAGCGEGRVCDRCLFSKGLSSLVPHVANGGEKF